MARQALAVLKPSVNWRFGGASSYGSPGTGGAMGFADVALRNALYAALSSRPPQGRCYPNALSSAIMTAKPPRNPSVAMSVVPLRTVSGISSSTTT